MRIGTLLSIKRIVDQVVDDGIQIQSAIDP